MCPCTHGHEDNIRADVAVYDRPSFWSGDALNLKIRLSEKPLRVVRQSAAGRDSCRRRVRRRTRDSCRHLTTPPGIVTLGNSLGGLQVERHDSDPLSRVLIRAFCRCDAANPEATEYLHPRPHGQSAV